MTELVFYYLPNQDHVIILPHRCRPQKSGFIRTKEGIFIIRRNFIPMKKLLPGILICLLPDYCEKTEKVIEEMIREISSASNNIKECLRFLN